MLGQAAQVAAGAVLERQFGIEPAEHAADLGQLVHQLAHARAQSDAAFDLWRSALTADGCFVEIIAYTPRVFVPLEPPAVLAAVLGRHPVQQVISPAEAA